MNWEQILAYITQLIQEIMESILTSGDLLQDKNKAALFLFIEESLKRLGLQIQDVIPIEIYNDYLDGVEQGTALLQQAGLAALPVAETGAAEMQKKMHYEAVQNIVQDTMMDSLAAIRTATQYAIKTIGDVLTRVKDDIAKGLIQGDVKRKVIQRVATTFAAEGMTSFITRDQRKLPLDFYAMTVVRTKLKVANTEGAMNRYKENGVKFVKINEHQPTCSVCARYQGKVVALEENDLGIPTIKEIPLPPYHPNCQHSVRPFMIQFMSDEEIQAEVKKWRGFSPEKDTRTPAQKRAYQKEQEIRRLANREKKDYAQMVAAMGDKAPKTIGAYRRMKRKNDERWKQLQQEYRQTIKQMNH